MIAKTAKCGILTALAIIVSALERLIPLQAVIPLPGIKLGLANCVILFILIKFGLTYAAPVMIAKCVIVGILFSGPVSMVFSLSGGFFAILGMFVLLRFKKIFSSITPRLFMPLWHIKGVCLLKLLEITRFIILSTLSLSYFS